MKTIYDLKLHEILLEQNIEAVITRVPGGWIYQLSDIMRNRDKVCNNLCTPVFVPLNVEFRPKMPEEKR